jgi:hypothetical protein
MMQTSEASFRKGRQPMSQFSFTTDTQSEQYCREIIAALVRSFGLSQSDALLLLNGGWKGQDFVGEKDLRYHRGGPEDWAKHIFHQWYLKDLHRLSRTSLTDSSDRH